MSDSFRMSWLANLCDRRQPPEIGGTILSTSPS
jgi:hypothetical protein